MGMIPGMIGLKHKERLKALGLHELEFRRMGGNEWACN